MPCDAVLILILCSQALARHAGRPDAIAAFITTRAVIIKLAVASRKRGNGNDASAGRGSARISTGRVLSVTAVGEAFAESTRKRGKCYLIRTLTSVSRVVRPRRGVWLEGRNATVRAGAAGGRCRHVLPVAARRYPVPLEGRRSEQARGIGGRAGVCPARVRRSGRGAWNICTAAWSRNPFARA